MKNTTEEKREAIPNSVSRMLLAGIGVLLQVLWIFWLALKLNDYSTAIQVCTSVLTFLITLRIYGLHINSAYKISWIILILLFPIFGLTLYLLFGRSGAAGITHPFCSSAVPCPTRTASPATTPAICRTARATPPMTTPM